MDRDPKKNKCFFSRIDIFIGRKNFQPIFCVSEKIHSLICILNVTVFQYFLFLQRLFFWKYWRFVNIFFWNCKTSVLFSAIKLENTPRFVCGFDFRLFYNLGYCFSIFWISNAWLWRIIVKLMSSCHYEFSIKCIFFVCKSKFILFFAWYKCDSCINTCFFATWKIQLFKNKKNQKVKK